MKRQPNRLPADARHGFSGGAIERDKPLAFRLNGRTYEAFAGDTVLSALLAAGVDGAGFFNGEPVALDERFAPPVVPRGAAGDPARVLPMDRTPILPGLELATVGPTQRRLPLPGPISRLAARVRPPGRNLGHRLDETRAFEGPWTRLAPATAIAADTVVVGGGIAGMTAALAAAAAGDRVVLVERRLSLGGDASFFGTVGDEPAPETTIAQLMQRIGETPVITVLLGADAFGLTGTRITVHQVRAVDGRPEGRVVDLAAPRIVLATGTAERLPVFPGNRMPGVVGAVAAYQRAERYGLWQGRRALVTMPHSFGYRLALLAADAGIEIQRAVDSRINAQSRFVDFCKASGITLAGGQVPRLAEVPRRDRARLAVALAGVIDEVMRDTAAVVTDLLVAAGGWQPRLALWLMAGGRAVWDPRRRWLGAGGSLESVVLCGAAAGWRSSTACLASAEQAVATLLGKAPRPIDDPELDAIYESPDDPTPVAPWRAGRPAFLDRGLSFTPRPPPQREAPVAATLHSLSIADVAAAVQLEAIPAADAGAIAEERCLGARDIADTGWRVPQSDGPPPLSPPWLHGRFGPRPQLVVVAATDARFLEAGSLLYPASDARDPTAAIGVVVAPAPEGKPGGLAVVHRAALAAAPTLFVRDTSGAVPVRIVEKRKG